jgi:hypothetical protein
MVHGPERPFLVCYEYGTGGVWWWITATSPDAIIAKYRDVIVFDQPPDWWDADRDRLTPHRKLSDPPDTALALLSRS